MTEKYFQERLEQYGDKEVLIALSRDMIGTWEDSPEILTELLIRFLFFERLYSEADMVLHNKAVEMLYDMGIFEEGKELDIVKRLLERADVPKILQEDN